MSDERTYRVNPAVQLRQVGPHYMIVEAAAGNVNMAAVYNLNATAARLWQQLAAAPATAAQLAAWLCSVYEVDAATARADAQRQLDEWAQMGLVRGE